MTYFTENNWVSWRYDNGPLGARSKSPYESFSLYYEQKDYEIGTLWEEAVKGAKTTMDHYPNLRPSLFFSGGLDSEIMVRAFCSIGANPKVYTVRYENDINIYDVSYAVAIASSLNIETKIIDFNLKKFYENDAEKVSEIAQCDRPRMLPQMTFPDLVDGLPIIAMSDVTWQRNHGDYDKKGVWKAWELESDCACDRYSMALNRTAICQWGRWSPGILLAHTRWNWFNNLINDKYLNKKGNSSTKILGFKEEFPNLIDRKKKIGFENCEDTIQEFEQFLKDKYKGLPYRRQEELTVDELFLRITGSNHADKIFSPQFHYRENLQGC